ncbi:MAG: two pore domain potassium channel family protein [Candidatus Brocadiae bacterium]|nr:two pore domain potassium channel family protein [Candidatus Brocadiia bacterium]
MQNCFAPELNEYPKALYFSAVTFTTLGYGDVKPLWNSSPLLKLLVASEALLGPIMTALFLVATSRRVFQE